MKKIFALFVAALFCTNISAQTLNETFEGEGFPPEGWSVTNNSTTGWIKGVKGGTNCAYVPQGTADAWLITPRLKPANGETLKFSARRHEADEGKLYVAVSLSGTATASFEVLETYTLNSSGDDAHRIWKDEWREFTIDLSAYKGQSINIAFHASGYIGNGGVAIDNVKGVTITGDADCENPSNIVLSDLQAHSATFTWQGTADQYQYQQYRSRLYHGYRCRSAHSIRSLR